MLYIQPRILQKLITSLRQSCRIWNTQVKLLEVLFQLQYHIGYEQGVVTSLTTAFARLLLGIYGLGDFSLFLFQKRLFILLTRTLNIEGKKYG